jgi:hypothetical protein
MGTFHGLWFKKVMRMDGDGVVNSQLLENIGQVLKHQTALRDIRVAQMELDQVVALATTDIDN